MVGILSDEFATSIDIRVITEGTSVLGGSTPTTVSTSVTTTTGLLQELSTTEAIAAGLTGERTSAMVFLTEYAALEAATHHLRIATLDWEVKRIRQLAGSHTEALVELVGDG